MESETSPESEGQSGKFLLMGEQQEEGPAVLVLSLSAGDILFKQGGFMGLFC